jgi:hypothetical protein
MTRNETKVPGSGVVLDGAAYRIEPMTYALRGACSPAPIA